MGILILFNKKIVHNYQKEFQFQKIPTEGQLLEMLELQMKKLLWLCTDQLFIKTVIILQNSKLSEFQVLTTNLITKLQAHHC